MDKEEYIDVSEEFTISFLNQDEEDSKHEEEILELKGRLNAYKKLVEQFLKKLKSNPEATTIKWPDRIADIKKFEKQLQQTLLKDLK